MLRRWVQVPLRRCSPILCDCPWPIVISLALNSVTEYHGSFAGILGTGMGIGGAVVPLMMGRIGDHLGLRSGMLLLYLTFGFVLSIGFWAKPLISNATIDVK